MWQRPGESGEGHSEGKRVGMYIHVESDTTALAVWSRVGGLSGLGSLFLLAFLEVPEPCLTLLGAGERAGGVRGAGYCAAAAAAVICLVPNCRRVSAATAACISRDPTAATAVQDWVVVVASTAVAAPSSIPVPYQDVVVRRAAAVRGAAAATPTRTLECL